MPMRKFDYSLNFAEINFRSSPELYTVGRGEQGVLLVEPYKTEILPYWKFKNEEVAKTSAKKIYSLFLAYKRDHDFVGMDMSRKFIQMGYTRARRYANHTSGKKYLSNPQKGKTAAETKRLRGRTLPQAADWKTNEKARAARVFFGYYEKVMNDKKYLRLRDEHRGRFEAK